MSAPVCFIDTETLGLDADHHAVWEIGLILPSGWEHEWQVRVTDRELALAHPKALEISRFEGRYGKADRAPTLPSIVAAELYGAIPEGAHLAGSVVSFDEERLRRLMWRHGFSPRWHYHLIDCEVLAAGWLASGAGESRGFLPMDPPWESEALSRAVGVEPDRFDRHTALGDARWAAAVYNAVMVGHG